MRAILLMIVCALTVAAAPAARAMEPFKVYDKFTEQPLGPTRWLEGERSRIVKGGALHLMQRTWSLSGSDSGLTGTNWHSNFAEPATITEMRARVTVIALETAACPSNPGTIADVRTRLIGGFFNIGTPVPGSQVGDATAQIRLIRTSNSSDPPGILRVQGALAYCTTPDCSFSVGLGTVELGTVAVGTSTTLQMQWDQPSKTFYFSRDGGAHGGAVAYAVADAAPPSLLYRQLSTRVNVPNCKSAAAVNGFVDARFDNVFVNQSALP